MKTTKKLLSVLLAVVMMVSSMSVCFGTFTLTASAVSSNELQTAFAAITDKSTTAGDGTMLAAAEKLYTWYTENASTTSATAKTNWKGEFSSYSTVTNNSNVDLYDSAVKAAGSGYSSLIAAVIPTSGVTDDSQATMNTTSGSYVYKVTDGITKTATITSSFDNVLCSYASVSALPESFTSSVTYTYEHQQGQHSTRKSTWGTYTYYTYSYHYLKSWSRSATTTQTNKAKLVDFENYFNAQNLDLTVAELVANYDHATLETMVANNTTAYSNSNGFSSTVLNHFFDMAAINAYVENCKQAANVAVVIPYIDSLKDAMAAGYDSNDYASMTSIMTTQSAKYDFIKNNATAFNYVIENVDGYSDFSTADVDAWFAQLEYDIDVYEVKELKTKIDADMKAYADWTIDDVDNEVINGSDITAALSVINADISKLNQYTDKVVADVCGANYESELAALKAELSYLGSAAGYNADFYTQYNKYANEVVVNFDFNADSVTLMGIEQNYKSWYVGLQNLIATMEGQLREGDAEKLFDDLNEPMVAYMEQAYSVLNQRMTTEIDTAYEMYENILAEYGEEITMINLSLYADVKAAVGAINTDVYAYLKNSAYNKLSAETVAKYDKLNSIIVAYQNFKATIGFDMYETYSLDEIVREESSADIARENDYTVTDENVENIISLLDALLNNEEVKALLGDLINKDDEGNPTGEAFDIAAMVNDALNGIYTDDVINAIIQYVYPIVAKEFAKVWAGLPADITIEGVDTGIASLKADVVADLYLYSVEEATASFGIATYPVQLGKLIANNYPAYSSVANTLKSVTTAANYDKATEVFTNPWEDSALYTEDGKKLNLTWGVKDRESFIDAAVAALSGLEPMLLAIVSNIAYDNDVTNKESSDYRGNKIGTGGGDADVKTGLPWPSSISLDLTIEPISLVFRCSANDGYDNVIAPLFELLGIPASEIPHGETLTSTRKILENGLFAMLDKVIAMLAEKPVETILNLLPNLAYILEADVIQDILGFLKTDITYEADAKYSVNAYLTTVDGNMQAAMKSEEPIKINIGERVKLSDLGLDLSSFNAVWKMITDLIGMDLPCPNSGMLASMGKLTWNETNRSEWIYTPLESGKAAYIKANKADLLIYLINYVLTSGIIDSFIDIETADALVKEILTNVTTDPDMVIAAVVELLNAIKYDTLDEYDWYDGSYGGTVEGMTPANEVYLTYENNWNKETADYVVENINDILNSVLTTAGLELDLSKTIADAVDGIFTQENINKIKALVAGLFEGEAAGTIETITPLVKELIGIDLNAVKAAVVADNGTATVDETVAYTREQFVTDLVAILEPLTPVLDFILKGENITITADENNKVKLIGYNGYDNAIVPILEALGATTGDATIESVLNSLLGVIAKVEADPINEIINLLPGVLYFIASDGLTTAVRNLLQGVYVILDTIRPIYNVDLNAILADALKDSAISVDLNNLGIDFVIGLVETLLKDNFDLSSLKTLIYDVCKVIGVNYDSASEFLGEDAMRGEYTEGVFDAADMVTVILSFAVDFLKADGNAAKLDEMLGTDGILNGLLAVFEGTDVETKKINWMYYFDEDTDFTDYDFDLGISIEPTMSYLGYPTNWTEETAKYVDENLAQIVNNVVSLIDVKGKKYENLSALLNSLLVKTDEKTGESKHLIYSADNVIAIRDLVANLLKDIDTTLLEAAGVLLSADINAFAAHPVGEVKDGASFAKELASLLGEIDGLVNWLLFDADYRFLYSADGSDAITIYGGEGYAKGLALILEALGVELGDAGNDVEKILAATFARVDAILADPINEVLNMLPNVIYFINADGISACVHNLLSAVYALLETLKNLGVDLKINELIGDEIGIDITKLDVETLITLAEDALKLELTPAAKVLDGFFVGTIKTYESVSGEYAYKMVYDSDFARYDMITILATVVLEVVKLEQNKATLVDLVGEEAYTAIINFFDMYEVPVQEFSWQFTDKADTGYVFSAVETSELYSNHKYGPMYTEEMAQYIADNIGDFIDNVIYLLGIQIDGKNINTLTDLLNGLVNGNLYNSKNAEAIRDALIGVVDDLEKLGNGAGKHIIAVLRTSLGVDLSAYDKMTFEAFDNDRAKFEAALCQIAEPLFPLLKFLLANEDFTFFADENNEVLITLKGAEGYAYGIIPILEVLDCKNIITKDAYYAAVKADESILLTSILTPLLDRVDVIINNPAEEILAILPNLIYFINSNGVDTVVKNTLNAVYTVLNAIEPIAKIDLYEIIGLDLSTLTFEKLFQMLLDLIADATGYEFANLNASAVAELTVGTLVSYDSANGKKAYKMVYQSETAEAEMVTVVMRLIVTFIMHENNREMLIGILKNNLNMEAEAEKYVRGVLNTMAELATETYLGMDQALAMLYHLYYGLDTGADQLAGGLKDLNAKWQEALRKLGKTEDGNGNSIGDAIAAFLDVYLEDVLTSEGLAPNGFIAFFQKIAAWFQKIVDFFKNLFN